ncbi:MAG: hypothetical protein ACI4XH_07870 [Acutalibacteraceae bacterium]
MINLWNYKDVETVRIIDNNGNEYEGDIIDITDSEEKSDLEFPEDSITIVFNDEHIEFNQSEIKLIKVIK